MVGGSQRDTSCLCKLYSPCLKILVSRAESNADLYVSFLFSYAPITLSHISERVSESPKIFSAVFGPTPTRPGMLSHLSPHKVCTIQFLSALFSEMVSRSPFLRRIQGMVFISLSPETMTRVGCTSSVASMPITSSASRLG